jgi:hypothetical protein
LASIGTGVVAAVEIDRQHHYIWRLRLALALRSYGILVPVGPPLGCVTLDKVLLPLTHLPPRAVVKAAVLSGIHGTLPYCTIVIYQMPCTCTISLVPPYRRRKGL